MCKCQYAHGAPIIHPPPPPTHAPPPPPEAKWQDSRQTKHIQVQKKQTHDILWMPYHHLMNCMACLNLCPLP